MKSVKVCKTLLHGRAGWVLLCALTVESAIGATMDISASFRPDPANPHENKFTNDTPMSGYCQSQPEFCKDKDLFSLLIPIEFRSVAPIEAEHANSRRGAMFRVPGDWRRLTVRKVDSAETSQVEVRIVSIGGRYILPDTAENLVGEGDPTNVQGWHTRLWGDWDWGPPKPCQATSGMYTDPHQKNFFWMTTTSRECAARANYAIPSLFYDRVQIGYELRTPDPLQMSAGQYTGNLTYNIGPGMDFDMGDVMYPDDSTLTLNFTLDVNHTLKIDIPPGGNKIELVPEGGWQTWLQSGGKPARLFRDQTFHISASSRFKMMLECDSLSADSCFLRNNFGAPVNVTTSVTLPDGLTVSGRPVNKRRLMNGYWSVSFQPGHYIDRQAGTLHFEIPRSETVRILQPGVAAEYYGTITVIWDSEV